MQTVTAKESKTDSQDQITIALAGNPNAGKTTLFNALTGLRQKVANYPGVTVERKEGVWRFSEEGTTARLIDLPGLYSLDAASLDEEIARDALTGKLAGVSVPDVVVAVVDATNLERNLYLVTQLLEYKLPLVVALTMIDEAERNEIEVNVENLSRALNVPVVPVVAGQKRGLDELKDEILKVVNTKPDYSALPFFKQNGHAETGNAKIVARYAWISRVVSDVVEEKQEVGLTFSEKLDRVLTHRFFGLVILAGILLLVFQTIFSWAALPMDLLDQGFGALSEVTKNSLPPGLLTDLLTDGVIAGVGGVLVFLPQIILLFLFISILEDTGYMSRAAFLMDRLMRSVGLHGKAFVPLLSSFACAIPGIMATRTIENPKDRLATILIAPLMSCSARLPVYTLMIAAFFSGQYIFGFLSVGAVLILAMYLLGITMAIIIAFILKRTLLKAPAPPFVMELPPYRLPNPKNVFLNVFQRAGMFVRRAGTIILAISIILWALTTFPRTENAKYDISTTDAQSVAQGNPVEEAVADAKVEDEAKAGEQLRNSFAGRLGHIIESVIAPLGFDWKMGVALIASFAAREVLVSTLSILYNVGKDAEAESDTLISAVRNAKRDDGTTAWTPLTALTMMVFFVLAMQCMSTIAIVRRETNSWKWTFFMIGYMTVLAYVGAFLTYQVGKLLGF